MKRIRTLGWLLLALAGQAHAQEQKSVEPGAFTIVKTGHVVDGATGLPMVRLNGTLTVQIDGDAPIDTSKVALRIAGFALGVEPRVQPDRRYLIFDLTRSDTNRAMWSKLLGAPLSHGRVYQVPVGVEIANRALAFRTQLDTPPANAAAATSGFGAVILQTFTPQRMFVGVLLIFVVVGLVVERCWTTSIIRDTVIPQMLREDRPFSLGRLQMAIWFCVIFASFVFILTVCDDINSITPEGFVLLGISSATALGAIAIDKNKDAKILAAESQLTAMGLTSAAQVTVLQAHAATNNRGNPAATVIPGVTLPGAPAPTFQQLWQAYQAVVADIRSAGFQKDLINDVNGPTLHRWQILVWTLVLSGIYLWRVYANLEMPTLGTNLLALMGISGGVYLGFKIPERQA